MAFSASYYGNTSKYDSANALLKAHSMLPAIPLSMAYAQVTWNWTAVLTIA